MPVQLTAKVTNADKVQLGLRTFGQAIPEIAGEDIGNALNAAWESYQGGEPGGYSVPEPAGSSYTRTGNLGASTYVEQRGASYTLRSDAISPSGQAYSVYVLGDASGGGQAWMHAGRWPLLRQVIEGYLAPLVQTIRGHLTQKARELFGGDTRV